MRLFFFLIVFSLSSSLSADTFFWSVAYNTVGAPSGSFPAPSPSKSCTALVTAHAFTEQSLSKIDETAFRCDFRISPNATGYALIGLSGSSCPDGQTLDPVEHECLPPPVDCSSTAGTTAYHLSATGKTRPTVDSPWPVGSVTGSPTMCSGACQYTLSQSTTVQCGSLKGGDPLIQYCLFKYSGSGLTCEPGDPQQNNGSTAPVPPTDPNDPADPANNCGPTHVWSGTTCVPKLDPDPSDPTDPTDPTDPGGGDPGGGNPGGGDPGGGDPGGGDPGGGDPGGGDPGDGEGGIKGLACDEQLTCEGDAMTCAQLTLQKALKCDAEDATDFPSQRDEISDFLKNPAYRMEEDEEVDISSYFKEGTRFLPSSCPLPKVFHLTTGGGRTFQFSYESICLFASDLGFLIVAAAGVFFAIYVGRAAGGE